MSDARGLRVGSFAGAAVIVDPTVLILALYIVATAVLGPGGFAALPGALAFLAAVLLAVLLHEFGHAAVAALLKLPSQRIVLTFFGGHVEYAWPPQSRWQDIAVSFAGPGANLATAALMIPLLPALRGTFDTAAPPLWLLFASNLYFVSLVLGVLNLLPGHPLDGGRILRAGLSFFMPVPWARLIAGAMGMLLALLLGLYAMMQGMWWSVLIALFVALAALAEVKASMQPTPPRSA